MSNQIEKNVNMELNLNNDLIDGYLRDSEWSALTDLLHEKCKVIRDEESGIIYTKKPLKSDICEFTKILMKIVGLLKTNDSENLILLTKQCFVSLRNCAASGKQAQNDLRLNSSIINLSHEILNVVRYRSDEKSQSCTVMILQFFGNMVVGNEINQFIIWEMLSETLLEFLRPSFGIIASTTAMIIFNILRTHKSLIPDDIEFIRNIIELYNMDMEYALLILELIIPTMLINHYSNLSTEKRIVVLEVIFEMLPHALKSSISTELISHLSQQFKMKSDCILKTVTDYIEKIEPLEVVHLLQVLASSSSREDYLPVLQTDRSLLINCVFLLKSIHDISKEQNNSFSMIQKLSNLTLEGSDRSIQDHPGFGFKASLIRLIGNLCYRNVECQTLVRELECIQLMLDCCNIDARNPLIIQWTILAIRNLCEGNSENQAVIASLCKVGTVDSSVLKEMGLTLHSDGQNILGMLPLDKIN